MLAEAARRPTAKGRAEVERSAAVNGMADGNMRVMLAQDAAQEAKCDAWRVADAEVRPRPPMEGGRVDMRNA